MFDKCVFQLIGERSAEREQSQQQGVRGGEEQSQRGQERSAGRGDGAEGDAKDQKLTQLQTKGGAEGGKTAFPRACLVPEDGVLREGECAFSLMCRKLSRAQEQLSNTDCCATARRTYSHTFYC